MTLMMKLDCGRAGVIIGGRLSVLINIIMRDSVESVDTCRQVIRKISKSSAVVKHQSTV